MGFFNGLFALLSVVCLILLIVGLINPKWVKMKSRWKSTLVYFIAMLVCSVVVALTTSDEEKARQAAESKKRQQIEATEAEKKKIDSEQNKQESINPPQPAVIPEISKEPLKPVADEKINASLGFTPEEFRQKLNDEIIEAGVPSLTPLKKFEIKDGSFQVFNIANINLALNGKVNEKGKVSALTYIFVPNESTDDIAKIMLYVGLTAKVISPEIETKIKTEKIINLMTKAAKGFKSEKNYHSDKLGGVTYFATASPNIGVWAGFDASE
ncbi:hypothetical protein QK338_05170 [Acinetobacter ursingii]|uniref:hypothetical protein n=1 Tax=Acinetobacter ursingii TaxID=108980 RepID=UPI00249BDDE4|nr:hypothetical protein [Acinetobacter ursingii]MDI3237506.1 hypothetical protein [Acinetobacter ursingii]